jgi:hypothetical protein
MLFRAFWSSCGVDGISNRMHKGEAWRDSKGSGQGEHKQALVHTFALKAR